MIPFASQRGLGQDLATHLLNEHDNEMVELVEVNGAIAQDLHGAFAEWEAQAHALTRCENYLYSLSVNPDPAQDPITRDQYFDYIRRVEEKLGLTDQPRAVVFHSKYGREHCHVIWSRIDVDNEKAVQLAFDREKLMMVTREFARDHNLELPDGYHKDRDGKNKQLSLYEMHQQRITGLSKEEHMEQVTDAWRASDSPKAFIQALAERGYILATGKRPYVLIDFYGGMNALPKMINDKSVRTKDIRAFLEKDYPPESLPSVDEARELVAKHRKEIEAHAKSEQYADELAELKRSQEARRAGLEKAKSALKQRQHKSRNDLAARHKAERDALRSAHLAETRRIREARARNRPGELGRTFGRISGFTMLRKALHNYQDRKRTKAFLKQRKQLKDLQFKERLALARRLEMQTLDMKRKLRALEQVEKRELRSLEEAMRREAHCQGRGGRTQMPRLTLGMDRDAHTTKKRIDLTDTFDRAAEGKDTDGGKDGSSDGPRPQSKTKIRRYRRNRKRDQGLDRGR
ncbi:relaxase/mobilization nuclease domain-containing protein [endosymbiont of Ridgeia piscesae]|jgi:hypothetical protein|uniref:Relaxase/mobilization nuclease domain n=1 Tax=endosymbiont of Ridgeia piscesae TaxID=54398 RepID=A0A0T5Z8C3_9GAMM|nr:relaxase/mobilization nuclease domain-containing protein [endosymbiont of Ridgeia piscesae]KRT56444.1 Relaxase/mobilization nuclease domain [endosymbiont of Ridgeia piscesae]KRT58789.1 Relaxase/mobilization nuclease domain-containing protein [endosymbiont of Ridgeia piscesae]